MRIFDTPELFNVRAGVSTYGDIKCGICGEKYNEGNDASESYEGLSVAHIYFAGMTVCECCFEEIENEVLHRIPDILEWYAEILSMRKKRLSKDKKLLSKVTQNKGEKR